MEKQQIRVSTSSNKISSSEWVWHFVFSFLDYFGKRSESKFVRHSKPTIGSLQSQHSILELTRSVVAILILLKLWHLLACWTPRLLLLYPSITVGLSDIFLSFVTSIFFILVSHQGNQWNLYSLICRAESVQRPDNFFLVLNLPWPSIFSVDTTSSGVEPTTVRWKSS